MTEIAFIALMHLVQHPDQYHMQKVRVIGVAAVEFEHKALYISMGDYENAITKNAVWLDTDINDATKRFDRKYVLIEGIFDKNHLGHLRMYSGCLKDIDRVEVWSKDER